MGFDAVCFPEHHLHSEGIEMGSLPVLTQHVIHNTKRIKVGPIGYVLPGWNPLRAGAGNRLARSIDQGAHVRGLRARLSDPVAESDGAENSMSARPSSDKSEADRINREAFEEVFRFLKLAWGDEPFRFKGKHYEYPSPQEGTPWPAHDGRASLASPAKSTKQGRIQMINVVPKPFQRPHPTLFQAFSVSEETVRWCAREGIIPTILLPQPPVVRKFVEAYHEESHKAGRNLKLARTSACCIRSTSATLKQHARKLAEDGVCSAFQKFFHHFGFSEAWREPEDEVKYPHGKTMLPASEVTLERFERSDSHSREHPATCGKISTRWSRMRIPNGSCGKAIKVCCRSKS